MQQGITIEVFREPAVPQSEVLYALEGISLVHGVSNAIELTKDSRTLHLKSDPAWVNTDKIRWPKFSANINIVLTNKALQNNKELESVETGDNLAVSNHLGRAIGKLGLLSMSSVLLVSTQDPESIVSTTAHEIGHAVGLKRKGEYFDGFGHCMSTECLMFPFDTTQTTTVRTVSKFMGLYRKQVEETELTRNGHEFCGECTYQAGYNLHFLKQYKNGVHVTPLLLHYGQAIQNM